MNLPSFITKYNVIWSIVMLIFGIITLCIMITYQTVPFNDDYDIWNKCDNNSEEIVDYCSLVKACSVLGCLSSLLFIIFLGLYAFLREKDVKLYLGLSVLFGSLMIAFQIIIVIFSKQLMGPKESQVGYNLALSSLIIICMIIFFSPLFIFMINYFGKKFIETKPNYMLDIGKRPVYGLKNYNF